MRGRKNTATLFHSFPKEERSRSALSEADAATPNFPSIRSSISCKRYVTTRCTRYRWTNEISLFIPLSASSTIFFLNISLLPHSRARLSIEFLQLCFNLPAIAVTVLITCQDLLSIVAWHGERVDSAIVTRWELYLTSGCTAVEYIGSVEPKSDSFQILTSNDSSCPINKLANFNWILHSL